MPLSGFHPTIQRWFAERLGEPSAPQRAGWPLIHAGKSTLIAAPTGSGKTLTAFLSAIDSLLRAGPELPDETRVLYVSPLKALSNDVQKNLDQPLREMHAMDPLLPGVRVLVRTGDTPASARAAMVRKPPHILVTTPESFYILLTSDSGRRMLKTVRTVIVDEIHALVRDKRGSHLALSLERLEALAGPFQRIGLSATQKPLEDVARFLVGVGRECEMVDVGHRRALDLGVEVPESPLSAVCSHETWNEIYQRIATLIGEHRTTLVFVNTRKLAERIAARLTTVLGEDQVTCHHGSMSRERRLDAEQRLKEGRLRALVATASLELGIDIGDVDLAIQIGSARSIATFLQRVGRAGHSLRQIPKGRLFPLTIDELVESAALMRAVRRGDLDRTPHPRAPLDILAQQIVAACAAETWDEQSLFDAFRRSWPYRDLSREYFDACVALHTHGKHGLLHRDGVGGRLRGRRRARIASITGGGAIPDVADYQVRLDPENTLVGSVNEDFAIESSAGDIFQLGNTSWRILRIEPGTLRVADAKGQPPSVPFWLGEAPGRTIELSHEVGRLREEACDVDWLGCECGLGDAAARQIADYFAEGRAALGTVPTHQRIVIERFFDESGGMQMVVHAPFGGRINRAWGLALRKRFCRGFGFELQAAANEDAIVISLGLQHSFPLAEVYNYLHPNSARHVLTQACLDQPMFASRWRWNTTRSLMIERMTGGRRVPAPIIRMRADDMLAQCFPHAIACPENLPAGDLHVPMEHPIVRQTIEDCLHEAMDIDGFLELLGAIHDGRIERVAIDTPAPSAFARGILAARPYGFLDDAPLEERRTQAVIARRGLDARAADDLGALDPAAVQRVRDEIWPQPASAEEVHEALLWMGYATDAEAATWNAAASRSRPTASDATDAEAAMWRADVPPETASSTSGLVDPCRRHEARVAQRFNAGDAGAQQPSPVGTAERVVSTGETGPDWLSHLAAGNRVRRNSGCWFAVDGMTDRKSILRGRLEALGPVFADDSRIAACAGGDSTVEQLLTALEREGAILRTRLDGRQAWCERRLLARIHRYTLDRLRAEIEPLSAAEFLRFLAAWQHVDPEYRLDGPRGVAQIVRQLAGFEIPAAMWEATVLPSRVRDYKREWLDELALTGELTWGRLWGAGGSAIRTTPICLLPRDELEMWLSLRGGPFLLSVSGAARDVLDALTSRGAMFAQEIAKSAELLPTHLEMALADLISHAQITCDSFAGLRQLIVPPSRRRTQVRAVGRWSILPATTHGVTTQTHAVTTQTRGVTPQAREVTPLPGREGLGEGRARQPQQRVRPSPPQSRRLADDQIEFVARRLLDRTGVVFRRTIEREKLPIPWFEILRALRRMELRGDVRGGRFVSGFSGEQYALPGAVELLRSIRRKSRATVAAGPRPVRESPDHLPRAGAAETRPGGAADANTPISVPAADPLNFRGILTPDPRVSPQTRRHVSVG